MKSSVISVGLIIIAIAATPLLSLLFCNSDVSNSNGEKSAVTATVKTEKEKNSDSKKSEKVTDKTADKTVNAIENSTFKIYDKASKKIIAVSDTDFCCGALATETEADIPAEALKAQAVALHSYYSYLRDESRKAGKDFDFECNSSIWEVYAAENDIKEKWGDTFEENYGAIKSAVNAVGNTLVLYNGKAAMTKYFEISSGTTDSYKEIYGENIEYLTSRPSPYDTVANNYKTVQEISVKDFDSAIKKSFSNYTPKGGKNGSISEINKNSNGTVLSVKAGNKEIDGTKLCEILGLRSKCFEAEYKDNKYIFTTLGYGDNIGLSKFGSCQMAKQGSTYIEILQYYYPNTKIE